MIHTEALPGTPRYGGRVRPVIDKALTEARLYTDNGIRALMIENMHDVPYLKRTAGPEITAMMTRIAAALKERYPDIPLGIQILAGANKQALAAALASGADFIRAEGFVFGHLADEGYMDAQAGELLRYRKHIGAEHIALFTDIKKKHSSHALSADTDITDHAHAAEFFLSDGLIITGSSTGQVVNKAELEKLHGSTSLPVLIGSGITDHNLAELFPLADGFIVGSYFKEGGKWNAPVDPEKVRTLVRLHRQLSR